MPGMEVLKAFEGRPGRPRQQHVGEVDTRILNAALEVFLARGFGGASIAEIARVARAGKPTIYARFGAKDALFEAVVVRNVEANSRFEKYWSEGKGIEDRLIDFAVVLLELVLEEKTIGLLRVSISEACRFPEFAHKPIGMTLSHSEKSIARFLVELINEGLHDRNAISRASRILVELLVFPMLFRGLMGEDLGLLRREIRAYATDRVSSFLSAPGMTSMQQEFRGE